MLDARKTFRPDDPLRALGMRPAAPMVDDGLRALIAERLLDGVARDALLGELARRGVDLQTARAEVAAAQQHPYMKGAERLKARLAKRDWLLECRARLERMTPAAVPRLHRPDADSFFRDHYSRLMPAVLTGMVDDWPAMGWTLDALVQKLGNPEIEVQTGRETDPDFELNSIAHKSRLKWHDVLDRLRGDPCTNDFYVTANNSGVNRKALAPLWRDVGPLPGYLGESRLGDGFFWMGPRGTITPWHHDLTQNLLVNFVGRKRVTLASPAETPRMRNHRHCFSLFGADAGLGDALAANRPATVQLDIGPGEILFIPVGWWHHVEGLSLTIGMSFTNFVWDNDFSSFYTTEGML